MTTLIAYGTVEGHTRKVADAVEKQLREVGEDVIVFDTEKRTADVEFAGVDKAILAASVHERRHPKGFEVFAHSNRKALAKIPTLLLSISLRAAFDEGREEAQEYADEMKLRTGLDPDQELLVPGAIRSESYDYYASQVLQHVVLREQNFNPLARDHEFTDWDELAASVGRFLQSTSKG